jgi:hypothetical protein
VAKTAAGVVALVAIILVILQVVAAPAAMAARSPMDMGPAGTLVGVSNEKDFLRVMGKV